MCTGKVDINYRITLEIRPPHPHPPTPKRKKTLIHKSIQRYMDAYIYIYMCEKREGKGEIESAKKE